MHLLASLVLCQLAWAQAPRFSAKIHPLQFSGAPMVVDIEVQNSSKEPIKVPDLALRPDLVRFGLSYAGRRERRYNSPATGHEDAEWTLQAGDIRELRLEIPGSSGIQAQAVTVTMQLHHTRPPTTLDPMKLKLTSPQPVAADMSGIAAAPGCRNPDVAWVHQADDAAYLVLQHQVGERRYQLTLAELSEPAQPWLSHSRRDTLGERSIVWLTGSRKLHILRLRGQRARGDALAFDLPWPKVEVAGQPVTDKTGTLRIPVWVPAPAGDGGELRVATISGRNRPTTPRVVRLDGRPEQVLSTLNPDGSPIIIVVSEDAVDAYTQPDVPELPWPRRTLWRTQEGATALRVALGTYPPTSHDTGGTAILLATRWPTGVGTQWMTMQGTSLQGPALVPDLGELQQVVPRGEDWPALLFEDGTLVVGDQQSGLSGTGILATTPSAGLVWHTLTQDGPVRDQPVKLSR